MAVSSGGGVSPRWRADGRELFYLAPDSTLYAAAIGERGDGRSIAVGQATRLFKAPTFSGFTSNARIEYVVAPDGQRFLLNKPIEGFSPPPLTVMLNWTAALNK